MTGHTLTALRRAGVVEEVPADRETALLYLEDAERHLASAEHLVESDPSGAYLLLYDAGRKAISAHMLAAGLRTRAIPGSHRAVAVYAQETLGEGEGSEDVRRFDHIRRNRNRAQYAVRRFGRAEVRKDLGHARGIVRAVGDLLGGRPR